jgi:NTP pyrophosphatase (non-canonical NTP hydrolase)
MTFDDYEDEILHLAVYPNRGSNLVYPAMGVSGEAGEFLDKVKKMWRNTGRMDSSGFTDEQVEEAVKELGDVLWYLAAAANELGTCLNEVARKNITKLQDRNKRGVVKGVGDNR